MTAAVDLGAVAGELGTVSLDVLARALLAPDATARAARDWCKRHGVPYRRDGKYNFVRLADVRAALDALPTGRPARAPTRAAALVARLTGRQ